MNGKKLFMFMQGLFYLAGTLLHIAFLILLACAAGMFIVDYLSGRLG